MVEFVNKFEATAGGAAVYKYVLLTAQYISIHKTCALLIV